MASSSSQELQSVIKTVSALHIPDPQRPPVEPADISRLLAFSTSSDPRILASMLEAFGDLARREVNRRVITDNGVPEVAVPLLTHEDEEVQTFAVRILANICFDSGASSADAGRMKVESLGGVPVIASMLSNMQNTKRLRMVLGCIANLVSNTEHLAEKMTKSLKVLSDCMLHPQPDIAAMATLALGNCLVNEEMKIEALKVDALGRLISKLENFQTSDISNVFSALSVFCETKPVADRVFNENGAFKLIFDFIDFYMHPEVEDEEKREDIEEEANGNIKAALDMLHDLAQLDDSFRLFFLSHAGVIDKLLSYTEFNSPWCKVAEEASKVLAYLSLSAEINKKVLFSKIDVFKNWLNVSEASGTEERRLSGAMIIGNLAEDEESAGKLIEAGAAEVLIRELGRGLDLISGSTHSESENMVEAAQNSEREGKEMRIKHLSASGLKNLAIHPSHKLALLQHDITTSLLALLKQRNEIVMHASITLLKSLFLAGESSTNRYLALDPHAVTLLSLTTKDEDNKKADHVFYEASRAIGTLILQSSEETRKSLLSHYDLPEDPASQSAIPVIDGKKYISPYTAVSNLIFSPFTILQQEGASVMLYLLQNHPSSALSVSKIPELVKHIASLLKLYLLELKDEQLVKPTSNDVNTFPHLSGLLVQLTLPSNNSSIRNPVLDDMESLKEIQSQVSEARKEVEEVKKFLALLASSSK